ncbi:MAG: tetratricopeptide repeat protein [Candidatus Omnitrophica bacterium]|nr:tetratricopeptide repeat protein [Candidatus Omnitrophota bacterium]
MQPNTQGKQYQLFSSRIFAIFVLCCLGIVIYSNTIDCVFYPDDNEALLRIGHPKWSIWSIDRLWHSNPTRFITSLSLALNYQFSPLDVSGYHMFNIAIHLGCAILVWWISLLTFKTPAIAGKCIVDRANLIAFFTGLVFLTHPVQIQAVTYIIQRSTSMSTLLCLLSLIFYIKARLSQKKAQAAHIPVFYYAGSLTIGAMAVLTKATAAILPFVILLYEFFFLKTEKGINRRRLMFFFVIVILMIITVGYLSGGLNLLKANSTESAYYYRLTQPRALLTYMRLLFIPIKQNFDYNYPVTRTIFEPAILISIFIIVLVFIIAIGTFSRHRLISFGIFWFFLSLLTTNLISREDIMNEHRLYMPMVGYSFFLTNTIYYLFTKRNEKSMALTLSAIIIFYSVLTYNRNFVWKNEITLWGDTVRKSSNKERPYINLGNAYARMGDFDRAIESYNKAMGAGSRYMPLAYYNRGNAYKQKGDIGKAISDYTMAIESEDNHGLAYSNKYKAYYNRGNAYRENGDLERAINDYTKAIELNSTYLYAYYSRGSIYEIKGELDRAISDYDKAITRSPVYGYGYLSRARAYFKKKDYGKGNADVRRAEESGIKISKKFLEKLKGTGKE